MADRQRIGRAILDSAADAVVAADRDGRIAFWNVGAERIFGRTAPEMAGEASLERPDNLEALIRADMSAPGPATRWRF